MLGLDNLVDFDREWRTSLLKIQELMNLIQDPKRGRLVHDCYFSGIVVVVGEAGCQGERDERAVLQCVQILVQASSEIVQVRHALGMHGLEPLESFRVADLGQVASEERRQASKSALKPGTKTDDLDLDLYAQKRLV